MTEYCFEAGEDENINSIATENRVKRESEDLDADDGSGDAVEATSVSDNGAIIDELTTLSIFDDETPIESTTIASMEDMDKQNSFEWHVKFCKSVFEPVIEPASEQNDEKSLLEKIYNALDVIYISGKLMLNLKINL